LIAPHFIFYDIIFIKYAKGSHNVIIISVFLNIFCYLEIQTDGVKMAKVILICGKICSGKSYYSKMLKQKINAVILSCDEVVFDLSMENIGDKHDDLVCKIKKYLYKKSLEIIEAGNNVILDFGFWSKKERDEVSRYYMERGIDFEWHYIDISDEEWKRNINERNDLVCKGLSRNFFVDEGLLKKMESIFEEPSKEEIDVWYIYKRL